MTELTKEQAKAAAEKLASAAKEKQSWAAALEEMPNFGKGKKKAERKQATVTLLYESPYMNRHERRKNRKLGMHVDLKLNVPYVRPREEAQEELIAA